MSHFKSFIKLSLIAIALLAANTNISQAMDDLEEATISNYGRNEFSGTVQEDTSNQNIHRSRVQPEAEEYSSYNNDNENVSDYTKETEHYPAERSSSVIGNIGSSLLGLLTSFCRLIATPFIGAWNVATGKY